MYSTTTHYSQYASMDENRLRFDIQRQYSRIQRAYQQQQQQQVPGGRQRHATTSLIRYHTPARATEGSVYAIAGLPPEKQVQFSQEHIMRMSGERVGVGSAHA